jgi:hypothetical protein
VVGWTERRKGIQEKFGVVGGFLNVEMRHNGSLREFRRFFE